MAQFKCQDIKCQDIKCQVQNKIVNTIICLNLLYQMIFWNYCKWFLNSKIKLGIMVYHYSAKFCVTVVNIKNSDAANVVDNIVNSY